MKEPLIIHKVAFALTFVGSLGAEVLVMRTTSGVVGHMIFLAVFAIAIGACLVAAQYERPQPPRR